jgi:putative Holliday junction resolvase
MPDAAAVRGTVMAFDFGKRRIGVAVGQSATRTASSLKTIGSRSGADWISIGKLVDEWRPALFVVGLPLSLDGEETVMSRAARSFGKTLKKKYGLDVHYADERWSSTTAGDRFAEMRAAGHARKKQAANLDSLAARIILENWLQSVPDSGFS